MMTEWEIERLPLDVEMANQAGRFKIFKDRNGNHLVGGFPQVILFNESSIHDGFVVEPDGTISIMLLNASAKYVPKFRDSHRNIGAVLESCYLSTDPDPPVKH